MHLPYGKAFRLCLGNDIDVRDWDEARHAQRMNSPLIVKRDIRCWNTRAKGTVELRKCKAMCV
ncbi:hypothetical protein DACRYDRAFT_24367 [Dacryopinax primogenitus]|uniref:Uncharacterized protein n=1 Tax=Dacryopinax primogenitus (strain DJM 731) TaxID=1858805 RepID=M5FPX1_DACPD|nr:uncharacterized protein DACRYDRAFT_24367 [Dacryopinax primogenitus]EJT98835.1 hypothetical protein DACRYDRAFT_24367 [Dacryopinax primogenitus]